MIPFWWMNDQGDKLYLVSPGIKINKVRVNNGIVEDATIDFNEEGGLCIIYKNESYAAADMISN